MGAGVKRKFRDLRFDLQKKFYKNENFFNTIRDIEAEVLREKAAKVRKQILLSMQLTVKR